jgi:hypothetical protein
LSGGRSWMWRSGGTPRPHGVVVDLHAVVRFACRAARR